MLALLLGATPAAAATFDEVHPLLLKTCEECHTAAGKAKKSKLLFTGVARADYDVTLPFVDKKSPAASKLLVKAQGKAHKKVFTPDSADSKVIEAWIAGGAKFGTGAAPAAAPAPKAAPVKEAVKAPAKSATAKADAAKAEAAKAEAAKAKAEAEAAAKAEAEAAAKAEAAKAEAAQAPAAVAVSSQAQAPAAAGEGFPPALAAAIRDSCGSCHAPGENAFGVHESDDAALAAEVRKHVQPGASKASVLWLRAKGEDHGGGEVWAEGSPELTQLAAWIDAGASTGASPATAAAPAAPAADAPVAAAPAAPAKDAAVKEGGRPGHPHGANGLTLFSLPGLGSVRLNGRFDLNYERRGYNDHPFQKQGDNAIRSYHQFLFLSRESAEDPVTASIEVLGLAFWELGVRVSPKDADYRLNAKLGKLVIPFGADPIYHHEYGGLAGFDQKVLPTFWAREGISLNGYKRFGPLQVGGDVYAVLGYALRRQDASLNLTSDFATADAAKVGFGARVGVNYGPGSVWYSGYYNKLNWGRQLYMQAVDVALQGPRGIPVLEKFNLGAGALRADISGGEGYGFGGANDDYYHFGSYLRARFYPTRWLYLQYRTGLRTFDNKRDFYIDDTDLTATDGHTHSLGVQARWRGLTGGIFHMWNFEKRDEAQDDFTRLVVAYEF